MRVNGNILLNTGLGLAVAYCAILAIWLGVESRTDHVKDMQPESFSPYVAVEVPGQDVVERSESIEETAQPGQSKKKTDKKRRDSMKAAVLQIVTNFEKADVTINGIPYPEYIEPGEEDGIVLPAGGPYDVRVTYSGKTKAYNIYLRPYETRMLIIELTGFQGGGTPPPARAPQAKAEPEKKEETGKEPGKVTVYSKPAGGIIVDGEKKPEKTPGTVEVANGRHEIQVEYEGGKVSEKKIVRVRDGSRIKLFFRERTDAAE